MAIDLARASRKLFAEGIWKFNCRLTIVNFQLSYNGLRIKYDPEEEETPLRLPMCALPRILLSILVQMKR